MPRIYLLDESRVADTIGFYPHETMSNCPICNRKRFHAPWTIALRRWGSPHDVNPPRSLLGDFVCSGTTIGTLARARRVLKDANLDLEWSKARVITETADQRPGEPMKNPPVIQVVQPKHPLSLLPFTKLKLLDTDRQRGLARPCRVCVPRYGWEPGDWVVPADATKLRAFTLREFPNCFLVVESVKKLLEAEDLTGIHYRHAGQTHASR